MHITHAESSKFNSSIRPYMYPSPYPPSLISSILFVHSFDFLFLFSSISSFLLFIITQFHHTAFNLLLFVFYLFFFMCALFYCSVRFEAIHFSKKEKKLTAFLMCFFCFHRLTINSFDLFVLQFRFYFDHFGKRKETNMINCFVCPPPSFTCKKPKKKLKSVLCRLFDLSFCILVYNYIHLTITYNYIF